MELTIKEVANLLNVSDKTIQQWIQERKLPAYKIHKQYRFNKSELHAWIIENHIPVSDKILELKVSKQPLSLLDLLHKGKILYSLEGSSVRQVLTNAVWLIPIPDEIEKSDVLSALLQREEMMTTGIGNGIAIPHPRNPIITDIDSESVSICFLKNPVDFQAIDAKLVHTLFIILSANVSRHLEILSKVAFLCQQIEFIAMLEHQVEAEKIYQFIARQESRWTNG